MKEHFCPVEQSTITYQGKCNWCGESEVKMTEPKVMHLKDWGATAMLNHAIDRIPNEETCIVLFYEDGELKTLSSHVDHQHAVWMYELAKLQTLHKCIPHEWEEA